jgi:hypothetical protein
LHVDLDGAGRLEPALQVDRAGASQDTMGFAALCSPHQERLDFGDGDALDGGGGRC